MQRRCPSIRTNHSGRGVRLAVTATALAMLTTGGWLALCSRYIANPRVDPIQPVDAVYVLGPALDKMEVARSAVNASDARTMVITVPADDDLLQQQLGCGGAQDYEILCVTPDPVTTQGESATLAELVRERGWTKVAVVTYTSHISRSRMLMERCVPAQVVMWERPDPTSRRLRMYRFAYETGAWAKAQVFRGC